MVEIHRVSSNILSICLQNCKKKNCEFSDRIRFIICNLRNSGWCRGVCDKNFLGKLEDVSLYDIEVKCCKNNTFSPLYYVSVVCR